MSGKLEFRKEKHRAMNFTSAVRKVSGIMTIMGPYETMRLEDHHTRCTFIAMCTYDEGGEKETEVGRGSVIILLNNERGFDPTKAEFCIAGNQWTDLTWYWDGEEFRLAKKNSEIATPVSATSNSSS